MRHFSEVGRSARSLQGLVTRSHHLIRPARAGPFDGIDPAISAGLDFLDVVFA